MKFLLPLVLALVSTSALASPRTIENPLRENSEMSMVPVGGLCNHLAGCYQVENATGWDLAIGNTAVDPGSMIVVDSATSGIPVGFYPWGDVVVGQYHDEILGDMPMVEGRFINVLLPGQSAYVKVSQGVNEVRAWAFQPELNENATMLVFDVLFPNENRPPGRVVKRYMGAPEQVAGKSCHTENDPYIETGSPKLARIVPGDCKH